MTGLTQGVAGYETTHAVTHNREALQCWVLLHVALDLLRKSLAASVYALVSLHNTHHLCEAA